MKIYPGPMTRKPANEKRYIKHRAHKVKAECDFCNLVANLGDQVIEETTHCLVIINLFGYDLWDGCGVSEHYMIIPRRHVASLSELTSEERIDYMSIVARYEADGYSLYARSPSNMTKSVVHQHMHFMKIDNTRKNWLLYIRRPHVLWMK